MAEITVNGLRFELFKRTNTARVKNIAKGFKNQSTYDIPEIVTFEGTKFCVTEIGEEAFFFSDISSIAIPNSVKSIGDEAFAGNYLCSILIPSSVIKISGNPFVGYTDPTSIIVAEDNKFYDSRENCNAIIHTASNTLICGCQSTTIPNSVTSIGGSAFYSLSGIGSGSQLKSITIPNSVISIGEYAFKGCKALTSITIPNSVTSIGKYAFYGCKALTSITIPNSVTSIGEYAFYGCEALTSITISNSVTSIGYKAFYDCKSLTSITISNSVISIGRGAFYSCDKLTSVTIENEEGKVAIGTDAFPSKAKITYVGKPKEQPAKPIENPYHQAILEVEKATAEQATATKAAEKTTVNVQTTPEPSQPVSPTTTQTRNRDKADYIFNGKKVNHGVWTLEIADDKSVKIYKNGEPCKKTSPALRELAAEIGFIYDPKWNTRQLGGKLFAQLIKLT